MCKDVSSFANSAGGQIVYSVKENKRIPTEIDHGADPSISKEWIEQVLDSRIQPRIEGLKVHPIQLETGLGFVLDIPQAISRAPHQAPDKRYYKRQNFQTVPMEDYEVRDALRRSTTSRLDVEVGFQKDAPPNEMPLNFQGEWLSWGRIVFTVSNLSDQPAQYGTLKTSIDKAFRLNNQSGFDVRTEASLLFNRECSQLTCNFGIPNSAPIFRESPTIVAAINISLSAQKMQDVEFVLACDLRTPGFVQKKRFPLSLDRLILKIGPGSEY